MNSQPMFDFHRIYQEYSTAALLQIVAQPQLYQPAAVHAAQQILQERNISEEERAESAAAIEIFIEKENKPGAVTTVARKIGHAITYLFTPSNTFDVRKWNYWLCIALVAVHIPGWINSVQFLWRATTHQGYTMHWTMFTGLFSILYVVGMILLLLSRHLLGWVMLIAFCSYEIIGRIYLFFAIKYFPNRLMMAVIIIGIYVLLIRLLAKPRVVVYFKGNYRLFKSSIIAGVIFAVLFMVLVSLKIS